MDNKVINKIKKQMQKKNINQTELANLLNVTESTISYYLSGTRNPKLKNIVKLCKILDMSIKDFI